jgi:hypothetical protein
MGLSFRARMMAPGSFDEEFVQEEFALGAVLVGVGAEFLDGASEIEGAGGWRHGCAVDDRDGKGDFFGEFPEEFFAGEAEDAAPDLVDVDGDDGDIGVFDDFLEAFSEREELSGAGDLAFCEDDNEFAVFESIGGGLERFFDFGGVASGHEGDDAGGFCDGLDPP